MALKTDLEKISDITLDDVFFIIIERMGLVEYYFLDPDVSKSYYERLIIINKDKPTLDKMEVEVLRYKKELLDLEKQKITILQNK